MINALIALLKPMLNIQNDVISVINLAGLIIRRLNLSAALILVAGFLLVLLNIMSPAPRRNGATLREMLFALNSPNRF